MKLSQSLLWVVSLFSFSVAMAGVPQIPYTVISESLKNSSQEKSTALSGSGKEVNLKMPNLPTYLVIVNATDEKIRWSNIKIGGFELLANRNDKILHERYADDIQLYFSGPNGTMFYDGINACSRAIVTIFGGRGYYEARIDRHYCY